MAVLPFAGNAERAHRLITPGTLLGTVLLGVACVSCDRLLQLPAVAADDYYRAGVDSATHCLLALVSWAVVVSDVPLPLHGCLKLVSVLLCGAISSLLDVDHFLAAGSIYLGDALMLSHRPPLHSTTLVLAVFLFLLVGIRATSAASSRRLHLLPYLFLTAALSHQLRDAARRGLWLWPLGSTPPLPYWLYVGLVCLLPVCVRLVTGGHLVAAHRNSVDPSRA